LTADRIDLAVVHLPATTSGTESLIIATGSLGMVMAATDELATRTSLTLRDLRDRQVLMTSAKVHPSVMSENRTALLNAGVTHLVELPHNDIVQTAAHVLRTGALTLTVLGDEDLPTTRVFAAPAFRVVPLDEPGLTLRAGIVWRRSAEETVPGLREVLAALKQRYESDPMPL
ncbi:LysR substrate-binding domain-containing protein, partial [Streptomyces sp. 2MCAF27]